MSGNVKTIKYLLHRSIETRTVAKGISVPYAYIRIEENQGEKGHYIFYETIPTRSNLYTLLKSLYFDQMTPHNKGMEINEEDVSIFKMLFMFRKHYGHWKEGIKILNEKGKDEARKWLVEKAQILGLLKAMMPTNENYDF